MTESVFQVHAISSRYASPWRFNERVMLMLNLNGKNRRSLRSRRWIAIQSI